MSPQDDNRDRIAKRRIRQVFEYLKALHEHRNPAIRQVSEQRWSMWLDDLPRHPAIERPARMVAGETSETESTDSETYFVLRVRRPRLTPAPPPPDTLRDWIQPGWDDIRQPAVHVESINVRSPEGPTVTVRFDDDPERSALLDEWQRRRAEWQTAELPAKAAMSVFDRLYELHGRLTRDAEKFELVVGDGILSWSQPDGSLYHPVVLQKVQLTFDPVIPEFRIVDADADSELYTAILQSIPNVDPRALRTSREELESGGYHPLALETSGLLAGLVNRLSAQGRILDDGRPPPGSTIH